MNPEPTNDGNGNPGGFGVPTDVTLPTSEGRVATGGEVFAPRRASDPSSKSDIPPFALFNSDSKIGAETLPEFVRFASSACIIVGLAVVLGWAFRIEALKTVLPGLVSMKVNAALGFALFGASLQLAISQPRLPWKLPVAYACAASLIVIGIVTLIEYVFSWEMGIDEFLFSDPREGTLYPGRPSLATASSFCLLGLALLLLRSTHSLLRGIAESSAFLVFLTSSLALVGYCYGVTSLNPFYPFCSMALHTAILFLVASSAVLYTRSDFTLMKPIRSSGPGGKLSRRMLPAIIVIITTAGWLQLKGQFLGFYHLEFGVALYCIATVTIFAVVVWLISRFLDRAENQRQQLAENLRNNQAEFAHMLRINTMNEMAAGISHDVNQPLTAIVSFARGTARRLKNGNVTHADFISVIEKIGSESVRASEIIRSMNRFVSKCSPQRALIDINDVVKDAVGITQSAANQRGASQTSRCQPELPAVLADRVQIEQVVVNLLNNGLDALEATPSKKWILVQTRLNTNREVEVAIADNGCGLPTDDEAKVFESFFTTKPEGVGMGLSISRSIIEAHDGRIWAERNDGPGTTFRFILPLKPPSTA